MNKGKYFIQYKGDFFSISLKIGINGNIRSKSILNFFGEQTQKRIKQYYKTNKEYKKEISKEWYKNNKEYKLKTSKIWKENNKEQCKRINRQWYENNKEHKLIKSKEWYTTNKEYKLQTNKEWRENNKERIKKTDKEWKATDIGKESLRKTNAKRKGLGFKPINNPFPECEGHHINYEDVIYIPKKLHHSIHHSVTQNYGMDKINKAAFEWYEVNK